MKTHSHLWTYIAVSNPEVPAIGVKLGIQEPEILFGNIKLGFDGSAAIGAGSFVPESTICVRGCDGVGWNRSSTFGQYPANVMRRKTYAAVVTVLRGKEPSNSIIPGGVTQT